MSKVHTISQEWMDGTEWNYSNWQYAVNDDMHEACAVLGYDPVFPGEWIDNACHWTTSFWDCVCKISTNQQ